MIKFKNTYKLKDKLDPVYLRYALRLALGCFITVLLYESLHIQNGYWAAFSVLACVFPTAGQSFKRSKDRIAGTFFGMILGILVAYVCGQHWLYIDLLIPLFVFLTVYLKVFSYSYYCIFNTVITVLLICLLVPGDWQMAVIRMKMTLLGVLIAVLVSYFILPSPINKDLPRYLAELRNNLREYYSSIIDAYINKESYHLQVIHAKTLAKLQQVMNAIHDSSHESLNFLKPKVMVNQYQMNIYQLPEKIYHILLLLETVIPAKIEDANLQWVKQPLSKILVNILNLFDGYNGNYRNKANCSSENVNKNIDSLNKDIDTILLRVKTLRIESVKDADIPIATFNEHIQLTKTFEYLNLLIAALRNTEQYSKP